VLAVLIDNFYAWNFALEAVSSLAFPQEALFFLLLMPSAGFL